MFDKEAMNQVVSAAVIAALEDQAKPILSEIVDKLLAKKVDKTTGREDGYGTKITWLEYLVSDHLNFIVRQSIIEWLKDQQQSITSAVHSKLTSEKMAEAIVARIEKSIDESSWSIQVKSDL